MTDIRAYRVSGPAATLTPADRKRAWIDQTPGRFAVHCLPLIIAAEAGWWLRSPGRVEATWDGGDGLGSLHVEGPALSHFGSGIVTWNLPYLFRTPPGVQLLAKGPANWPKDGAAALEGIIETDWAVATFTMNWKLTRPGTVVWDADEPICHVMPVRLSDFSEMAMRPAAISGETADQYAAWNKSRAEHLAAPWTKRQLHYRRGTSPGGASAAVHHTRVKARVLEEEPMRAPVHDDPTFCDLRTAKHLDEILNIGNPSDRGDGICELRDLNGDPMIEWATNAIVERISNAFGVEVVAETVLMSRMLPGASHPVHADAELEDGSPNHTPQRSHVGLLYLSEPEGGGVLSVWDADDPEYRQEFQPMPGRLVCIPATRHYMHQVSPVEGGQRDSLAVWVRRA